MNAAAIALSLVASLALLQPASKPAGEKQPAQPAQVRVDAPNTVLLGKLGRPFGTVVKVEGVLFDGGSKGYEDGPNLRIDKIDGKPLDRPVEIKVEAYFGKFGEKDGLARSLPALVFGARYEFDAFEEAATVGIPGEVLERTKFLVASCSPYLHCSLNVFDGRQIAPAPTPAARP